jgi:thiol-disulfide isomerase/thioredoxin
MNSFRSLGLRTILLTLLGVLASSGVAVTDVATVLKEFEGKREALFASGAADQAAYEQLVAETLAKIKIAELNVSELIKLNQMGLITPTNRAAAQTRIKTLFLRPSPDGLRARTLFLAAFPPGPGDEQAIAEFREVQKAFYADPLVPTLLQSEDGPLVARAVLTGGQDFADQILLLSEKFDANASHKLRTSALMYFQVASRYAATPVEREQLRARLADFAHQAIARGKAAGESEAWVQNVESAVRTLNGAAMRGTLLGNLAPPLDFEWASRPELRSLADLKGKVVVIDFWATWCGPCVSSFPQVRELQEHYKGYDVEIIGVTSLQGNIIGLEPPVIETKGDPQKEYALMREYIQKKEITWTIAFSRQDVFNPDFGVRGIPFVAIIDAEGKVRHVGLHPASPLEKKTALIDELLREAGKRTPTPR